MERSEMKSFIAKRVARELKDGDVVNLGIGLPTMIPSYLPDDVHVVLEAELGMAGAGGKPEVNDFNVCDAGGASSSIAVGGAFIDSATSFGLIRGGHVDVTILGALQVDEEGSLSSHIIPGKMVPGMGGAMDLVVGAERVIIAMEHTNKGQPRILKECNLPLTAAGEVDLIVTERGVLEVTPKGLVLKEINPAFSLQEVINSTEADLIIADTLTEIAV